MPSSVLLDMTASEVEGQLGYFVGGESETHDTDVVAADLRAGFPPAPAGYDLLRRLGGGGMGDVFLAREHTSERVVAMKFLRSPGNPTAVDRFLAEVRALGKLAHPNIVRVLATDFLRADPFFTMEYAPGGTLADRLNQHRPFAPREAAGLVATVARAVAAAHAANVLHRDLKPSNILLAADGTPRVSDFGLAKRTDRDDGLTLCTGPLGTPGFMPPEQVSRKYGEVGPAADVYGLGATLYFLLTGRPPFSGDTPAEIVTQVEMSQPERPRVLRSDTPAGLEAIALKCLEKRPAERYASADDLADDLEGWLAGRGQKAPELTRRRRLTRSLRRNGGRILTAVVGLAALAGVAALGMWRAPGKPRDVVAEYQRDLKAGKPVMLIPEKGLPAWFDRPINGVEVGTDVGADDACSLSSIRQGTLVLLPDVGIDRYSVEAEFRELRLHGGVARPGDAHQWCGLLVGYETGPLPQGGRMHSFLTIKFRDYDLGRQLGLNDWHTHVFCQAAAVVEQPGQNPEDIGGDSLFRYEFQPSPSQPGAWRKVKFTVAPDRIQAFWRDDKGEMVRFADMGPGEIGERIALTQKLLKLNVPLNWSPIPPWSPRGGVAVWCASASFAVRNVIITPEP